MCPMGPAPSWNSLAAKLNSCSGTSGKNRRDRTASPPATLYTSSPYHWPEYDARRVTPVDNQPRGLIRLKSKCFVDLSGPASYRREPTGNTGKAIGLYEYTPSFQICPPRPFSHAKSNPANTYIRPPTAAPTARFRRGKASP